MFEINDSQDKSTMKNYNTSEFVMKGVNRKINTRHSTLEDTSIRTSIVETKTEAFVNSNCLR